MVRSKKSVELDELLAKIVEEAGPQSVGWVEKELKELRKKSFGFLFDSQMRTLKDRGALEKIVKTFSERKRSVLRVAEKMDIESRSTPFIPVISGPVMGSLEQLMNMVRSGGQKGCAFFNFDRLSEVAFPHDLYFIFNVEMSETCENAIFGNDRSFLTTCEAIAFATHTEVLQQNAVVADGSRITKGSGEMAPSIKIYHDGYPVLGGNFEVIGEDPSKLRMIASCKSRVECL